jgi:hypothetical protein
MKGKRVRWDKVPWTDFAVCTLEGREGDEDMEQPDLVVKNSRYQVSLYFQVHPEFGEMAHLSIKTLDRAAHHDWRDLQRIKNELCGEQCDAVEIYPAESKLVDSANQYHLWVFRSYHLPFGFQTRLVADGSWRGTKQRPFEARPADCRNPEEMDQFLELLRAQKLKREAAP